MENSTITICPSDSYLICIECDVKDGVSLVWNFVLLGAPLSFTSDDAAGEEVVRSPITVTLSKVKYISGAGTTFRSQLRIPNNELRGAIEQRGGETEVICEASSSKRDRISIRVSGIDVVLCYFTDFLHTQVDINQRFNVPLSQIVL